MLRRSRSFLSSCLKFFCQPSRFLSRVVLLVLLGVKVWLGGFFPSLFLRVLGPFAFSLRWGLWTLLLARGRFILLSLSGPLAVQLRSFLCMWFRQNFGVSSFRRSLWWSTGCPDPGTFCWCCGTLSLPCLSLWSISLWTLGRGFLFCLSSACSFLFTAFSRQLAAIGDLLVVSSTSCCLYGVFLCSRSSQLSFSFLANVCWGPGGVLPFGPLHVLIRFLLLFQYLCLLLFVSLFASLNECGFAFLSGTWPSGCGVLPCLSVLFKEFHFSSLKVLLCLQGA